MSQSTKIIAAVAAVAGGAYIYKTYYSTAATPAFTGDGSWVDLKLKTYKDVSHDSRVLTFELPQSNQQSGLVTASLLLAKYVTPKGNNVIRPYTPISDTEQKGTIDFLVKKYETGKMGNHIFGLVPGTDSLSFKGPILKWKWEPNQFEDVTLIGGGTGITPLFQIVTQALKDKSDNTKINLLYGSLTPDDILLKPELDALAAAHPDQFKVQYFVDKKGDAPFDGKVGYISKDDIKAVAPAPSPTRHIFVCGPPALYKAVSGGKNSPTDQGEVTGILAELGYDKTQIFKF